MEFSKTLSQKKIIIIIIKAGDVAQWEGPGFNSQYCKKKIRPFRFPLVSNVSYFKHSDEYSLCTSMIISLR